MKVTEEAAITIPDDVRAAFMAFDDDYLADVLRLWDCDLKCWHEPLAVIFRFESDDIIVWFEKGSLKCTVGTVVESCLETSIPNAIKASIGAGACLCWLFDRTYSESIGSSNVCSALLKSLVQGGLYAKD